MENVCQLIELSYSPHTEERLPMENMPYLNAALLCERVIEEKDGVLSAFRIVDRYEYKIDTNIPDLNKLEIKPAVPMTLLVSIKSGPVSGKHKLNIDIVRPSGKTKQVANLPLELKGGEEGANLIVRMVVGTEEQGLHWFELRFDESLLTKVPFILVQSKQIDEKDEKTSAQNNTPH